MLIAEWKLEDALAFRFEEGIELGREQTARNMLAMGMTIEVTAQAVELPIEKVRSFVTQERTSRNYSEII